MPDMEIMREFDETLEIFNREVDLETYVKKQDVAKWLEPAVCREIVRVLEEVGEEMKTHAYNEAKLTVLNKHKAKYSPKPQYCEGMQEAIEMETIIVTCDGIGTESKGKSEGIRYYKRCPFCEEGNCIDNK